MSNKLMLISNKLHSFRNFLRLQTKIQIKIQRLVRLDKKSLYRKS